MDIFEHCWAAILNESSKCNVLIDKEICNKITNSTDECFELPANRLAYMYKFGIYNVHFFKKCFARFMHEYSESLKVVCHLNSSKVICSMSIGPGTDIIGLLFALKDIGYTLNEKVFFRVINKYGAWRNSMINLTSVEGSEIPLKYKTKLLQCDITTCLSDKVKNYLKEVDILLMDRSFASKNAQKDVILNTLNEILQNLKHGAYVFVIDTKVKLGYYEKMTAYGSYIYGPLEVQVENLPFDEKVAEAIGEKPLQFGKAYFGVWQKNINFENTAADSAGLLNVVPALSKHDILSPKETSFMSQSPKKVISLNDTSSDEFQKKIQHSEKVAFYTNFQSPLQNSAVDLSTRSLEIVDSASTNEITTMLKTFDELITKFENFFSSNEVSKKSSSLQFLNPVHSCRNVCHHCRPISISSACHHCKPVANSAVCHLCKPINKSNHACSCFAVRSEYCCATDNQNIHPNCQTSLLKKMVNDSDYQTGPHIVIPLQNVDSECVSQIMSLAMKKAS